MTSEKKAPLRARSRRASALMRPLEQILFAEGFRALSLDNLASRLRCSKRSLYEIGPNKAAMVKAVITAWSERICASAKSAEQAPDIWSKLERYLGPAIIEARALSAKFLEDVTSDAGVAAALEAHQRMRVDGLRKIIDEGLLGGEFAGLNSVLFADLSLGAIRRLNSPELLSRADLNFSEAFEAFYDFLLRGLQTYRPQ